MDLLGKTLGNYRIDRLLGEGGMGAVYQAYDMALQREAAIKLIHPHLARQPAFRERFMQEARLMARLDHPGIVKVFAFGKQGDLLFLPMEFISGGNLRQFLDELIRQKKWIPLEEATLLVRQLCRIVEYAHQKGVLHRDIKPANLMLKPEPSEGFPFRVVLTDLGLGKLVEGLGITQEGTSMGTPAYMSPEQALGQETDPRSDVYSLGVLLYELTVGRLPLEIQTITEAIRFHSRVEPPAPRFLRPDLPEALEHVILKALEKDPAKRYASAKELEAALSTAWSPSTEILDPAIQEGVSLTTEYLPDQASASRPEYASLMTILENKSSEPRGVSVFGDQSASPSSETRVQIVAKDTTTRFVTLRSDTATIGRDQENAIMLEDQKASRKHAQITRDGMDYYVMDLNSRNGTFLDNAKLLPGIPEIFKPGQTLHIGDTWLQLIPSKAKEPSLVGSVNNLSGLSAYTGSSAGLVAVSVTPQQLTLEPGQSGTASLSLLNQSRNVDHFSVSIDGIPSGWIASLPSTVELMPGEQKETAFTLLVPRQPESRSGSYPVSIHVNSQRDPSQLANVQIMLRVTRYAQYKPELHPLRLPAPGTGQVLIANQGNTQETFNVQFKDAANELIFQPSQLQVQVPEGKSATADYSVQPRQRKIIGGETAHSFSAQVGLPGTEPQTVQGELRSRAWIPVWAPSLAMMLCLALLGAATWAIGKQQSSNQAAQTATQLFSQGAQTATQLFSDLDQDGLSYEQEIAFGCNPDEPDSDDDGLRDSEERTWDTNCTVPDSDHDSLLDGDEVNNRKTHPMNSDTDGDQSPDNVDLAPGSPPTFTPSLTPVTPSPTPEPPTSTPMPMSTATPTHTSAPPAEKIVYVSNRDGNFEIYVMNTNGKKRKKLTENNVADFGPDWSPNGKKIVFASNREGNFEIYSMDADGSNVKRLTQNNANDYEPAWSPDGRKIIFSSNRDGNQEIYVMDANGENLQNLTISAAFDQHPAWSPNGNQIAFSSDRNGSFRIFIMNADGSNVRILTNSNEGAGSPAWSPDGSKVAFQALSNGNFEIYVISVDGNNLKMLTNNNVFDQRPTWSRDGNQIAFSSNRDGPLGIYVMDADGSNVRQLTDTTEDEPAWSR